MWGVCVCWIYRWGGVVYFVCMAFDFGVVEGVSVDEALGDVVSLRAGFVEGGGLCLRGCGWGLEDRARFLHGFGEGFGVGPGFGGGRGFSWVTFTDYVEISRGWGDRVPGVDDLVLMWHMENQQWRFPQLVGGWWMEAFGGRSGGGRFAPHGGSTGFVDMCDVLGLLPVSLSGWVEDVWVLGFPRGCPFEGVDAVGFEVVGVWERGEKVLVSFVGGGEVLAYSRPLVEDHFCSGRRVLRFPFVEDSWLGEGRCVWRVGGGVPSVGDGLRLGLLRDVVRKVVLGGGVGELWWDWLVDDFLVVDLHRGLHAVNGGFVPEERRMWSLWSHELGCSDEPRWELGDFVEGRGVWVV